jgi:hypothetical protein
MRFSRRRRSGRRQATRRPPRSLAVTVRKVDNTIVFPAKIDGFHIEKSRLEPFLKLNSVQLKRKQSRSIRPPKALDCFVAIARRKTGVLTNALWLLAMTTTVQPNGIMPQASTFSLYDRQRSTPSPDSDSAIAIAAMRS